MADKEIDKNQQEEDIDIDALFAKMMADKAASGEEIKQAEEEPEKAAPQPEAEKYAVAENSQETEEEPADDTGTEEASVETEPAETAESAEAEDTDEKEQPIPEADSVTDAVEAEYGSDMAAEAVAEESGQEEFVPVADIGTKKRFFTFSRRMLLQELDPIVALCINNTKFRTKT